MGALAELLWGLEGFFGGWGREDGGAEELFSYLEAEGVGEDEGQDVFGQVGDGYQEGGFGKVHACEEGELEGAQEVAGGEAGKAGSGTKEFVFQGGSGSAQEGEEEEAPDEAACFSGYDGEAAGEV